MEDRRVTHALGDLAGGRGDDEARRADVATYSAAAMLQQMDHLQHAIDQLQQYDSPPPPLCWRTLVCMRVT
jgi:hypothetical protein